MAQAAALDRGAADPARYAMIEEALAYLERSASEQPTLADVARHVGLSPTHFQRVFSEWVGVSPKKFLAYLTLDHAKRLLAERHTILDASLETGLSGPSRLHDLFLSWEAMSPGVYASGADGVTIRVATVETPFGEAVAMAVGDALCGLGFTAETGREAAEADLRARWPKARFVDDRAGVEPIIAAATQPRSSRGDGARLALIGAPFQIKVWEALLRVPSGTVTTYSDLASAIERPAAVRAVGTAVGRNPVSWLIPCHRALRKSGALGGYHWGLRVKRAMLAYEAARFDAA